MEHVDILRESCAAMNEDLVRLVASLAATRAAAAEAAAARGLGGRLAAWLAGAGGDEWTPRMASALAAAALASAALASAASALP